MSVRNEVVRLCPSTDRVCLLLASKIIIGVSVGIPASVLCISRRLYSLTAVKTVAITSRRVSSNVLLTTRPYLMPLAETKDGSHRPLHCGGGTSNHHDSS